MPSVGEVQTWAYMYTVDSLRKHVLMTAISSSSRLSAVRARKPEEWDDNALNATILLYLKVMTSDFPAHKD